jgi:hypothetical protein
MKKWSAWAGTTSVPEKLPGVRVFALDWRFGNAHSYPALRATLSRKERAG